MASLNELLSCRLVGIGRCSQCVVRFLEVLLLFVFVARCFGIALYT